MRRRCSATTICTCSPPTPACGRSRIRIPCAEILAAPDRRELIEWLARQPLARRGPAFCSCTPACCRSGRASEALNCAAEIGQRLGAKRLRDFLQEMYGNKPNRWSDTLRGDDRCASSINALTRVRFVATEGAMDLMFKGAADQAPAGTMPWFDHPAARDARHADRVRALVDLGVVCCSNVMGLDSGCVWGGKLTAMRLVTAHCSRSTARRARRRTTRPPDPPRLWSVPPRRASRNEPRARMCRPRQRVPVLRIVERRAAAETQAQSPVRPQSAVPQAIEAAPMSPSKAAASQNRPRSV